MRWIFVSWWSFGQEKCCRNSKKLCAFYGDDAIVESSVHKWLRSWNMKSDLQKWERSGSPAVIDDDDQIKTTD